MLKSSQQLFRLASAFQPRGDQAAAIAKLTAAIEAKQRHNVLLGLTGTGKTFTIANVIQQTQKATLVLSHNKTLATQLFSELKTFFPDNRVEYFISPFDFYQPEAYLPHSDVYIDKTVKWNHDVKTMRMQTLNALLTNSKVIVVASVAAIYAVLDPQKYAEFIQFLKVGAQLDYESFIRFLINAGYERVKLDLGAGQFIVRGNMITIGLPHEDAYLRLQISDHVLQQITKLASVTFDVLENLQEVLVFPAAEYVSDARTLEDACQSIYQEMLKTTRQFREKKQALKAHRLETRTMQDLENLRELGYCKGIENYSIHFETRQRGQPPFTLLDYFPDDFLIVIDESHITVPQLNAMYVADRSRKQVLVDYGFRLPTALDNRPLRFAEFNAKAAQILYTSATPGPYELAKINHQPVEQLLRPTGLLDPEVIVYPATQQIDRLIKEIKKAIAQKLRVFVLTLTIKMAEELTEYLQSQKLKVAYIHNRLKTFERTKVLINLRKGVFDVVIGINLLREGLDIPEIGLVCILDADKAGFLRSNSSLIQMMGRAARNVNGKVLLFADNISSAMRTTIAETKRRRQLQQAYNLQHHIVPQTIQKPIQDIFLDKSLQAFYDRIQAHKTSRLTRVQTKHIIRNLQDKIKTAVKNQDFELAAKIRDMIFDLM